MSTGMTQPGLLSCSIRASMEGGDFVRVHAEARIELGAEEKETRSASAERLQVAQLPFAARASRAAATGAEKMLHGQISGRDSRRICE